jgi:hypothetical protein
MSESIHAPALGVSGAEPDGGEVDSRSGWWCAGGSSARLESRRGLLHSQAEGPSRAWQSTLPCRGAGRSLAPNAPELIRRVSGTSLRGRAALLRREVHRPRSLTGVEGKTPLGHERAGEVIEVLDLLLDQARTAGEIVENFDMARPERFRVRKGSGRVRVGDGAGAGPKHSIQHPAGIASRRRRLAVAVRTLLAITWPAEIRAGRHG